MATGSVLATLVGSLGQGYVTGRQNVRQMDQQDELLRMRQEAQKQEADYRASTLARLNEQMRAQQAEAEARRAEQQAAAQAAAQQSAAERARRLQLLNARGIQGEEAEGIADDDGLFRQYAAPKAPEPTMTPYQQEQLKLQRDRLDFDRTKSAQDRTAAAQAPSQRPLTEGQRKASAFLRQAEAANQAIESVAGVTTDPKTGGVGQAGKRTPTLFERATTAVGLGGASNYLKSDEYRRMESAALRLSDAWLRYTSGAAVPEPEVKRFAQGFLPAPGDDEQTLRDKAEARRLIIVSLREGVGKPGDVDTQAELSIVNQFNLRPPPQ